MENFENYRGQPEQERPIISHEEEMLIEVESFIETTLKVKDLLTGEILFEPFLAELGLDIFRDKAFKTFTETNEEEKEPEEVEDFEYSKEREPEIQDLRGRSQKLFREVKK